MPSKTAQHIAFFAVLLVSAGIHWYVYANLKRVVLRDYPKFGPKFARIAFWTFVVMDSPFIFLYFRGYIFADMTTLTRVLIYPFSIWQTVMLMWAIVLVPFTLWRRSGKLGAVYVRDGIKRFRSRGEEMNEEEIGLEVVTE